MLLKKSNNFNNNNDENSRMDKRYSIISAVDKNITTYARGKIIITPYCTKAET